MNEDVENIFFTVHDNLRKSIVDVIAEHSVHFKGTPESFEYIKMAVLFNLLKATEFSVDTIVPFTTKQKYLIANRIDKWFIQYQCKDSICDEDINKDGKEYLKSILIGSDWGYL